MMALVGEYLGRIQRDVEGRPLYTVEQVLEPGEAAGPGRLTGSAEKLQPPAASLD
jgi:hypothetical protein